MGFNHKWNKVVGGDVCEYCGTIRIKRYMTYQNSLIYIDENRNILTKADDCEGRERIEGEIMREKEMRLLEIIDEAKDKGIMPVLSDGAFLRFKGDEVYTESKKGNLRRTFIVIDGEVTLATMIKNAKLKDLSVTNYWEGFFDLVETKVKKEIQERIGAKPELFTETIEYTDVKGKKKIIKEQRTIIVPVYRTVLEKETIKTIKFVK